MPIENKQKEFYNSQYSDSEYAKGIEGREEALGLKEFIEKYDLKDKKVLEIGCGRGAFQDLIEDWIGVDISSEVTNFLHKPFKVAEAENLPFEDNSFDAIWSITTLEHVINPEKALEEIIRVLKPDGVAYLAPA